MHVDSHMVIQAQGVINNLVMAFTNTPYGYFKPIVFINNCIIYI
jgi:hypothetical protein